MSAETRRSDGAARGRVDGVPGLTPREVEVCLRFGVVREEPAIDRTWPEQARVKPGTLTLVTGPSGSGKSLLLASLSRQRPACRWVDRMPFPGDVSVVDAVAPGQSLADALSALAASGLGEPAQWLRRFEHLSAGEQFRARLARALSLARRSPGCPLLCDEFGTLLHRRLARAIAFSLRKLVTRERLTVVVATAHDDLRADLAPDTVVRLTWRGEATVEAGARAARGPSLARRLRIERGSLREYEALAALHYRRRRQVGYVDRVYVLREGIGGEPLGVVVYGHSPLELSLRNEATGGRYRGDAARLNREVRILRRLVMHPDVRGCGLGHRLVAETLPRVGTKYVECLAAMGVVNPVFEKAGMRRIGLCAQPDGLRESMRAIAALGADPLATDFVEAVCRRPAVRRIVAKAVCDWYRASTGGGDRRVARQDPATLARTYRQMVGSQPVYYLWSRDGQAMEATVGERDGRRREAG